MDHPPIEFVYYLFLVALFAILLRIVDIACRHQSKKFLFIIILFPPTILYTIVVKWQKSKVPLLLIAVLFMLMSGISSLAGFDFTTEFIDDFINFAFWPIWVLKEIFL